MTEYGNVVIIDCTTHEVTERPHTPEEIAVIEANRIEDGARKDAIAAEFEVKVAAKASAEAKLAALGLTAEEIAAL